MVVLKNYCNKKEHLNKMSEEATNLIKESFKTTIYRFSCKLPLNIPTFSKYYYTNLSQLIDDL